MYCKFIAADELTGMKTEDEIIGMAQMIRCSI